MAMTSAQIRDLLIPYLSAVTGDYAKYPTQWSEFYTTHKTKMLQDREVEMKYTGLAAIRPEGSPTTFDTMGERMLVTYTQRQVSLGFSITYLAQIGNLYKSKFPGQLSALKGSMAQTKETLGASLLSNGFNAAFPIGDGQPFFSVNHPIDTGVVANTPAVQADLNEASLESGILTIRQFKDRAGLITQCKPEKLIVGFQNEFVAERLTKSQFRTGGGLNDVAATVSLGSIPKGYRVNQYVTLPNAWWINTNAPDGMKLYQLEALKTDIYSDFSTDNLLCKATEIYSFGVTNFRCMYGSNGP